jgi:pyridoxine 5-phosphate synthase
MPIISKIKDLGVRVSLFVEAEENAIENAYNTGTDRIELYTGPYAAQYPLDKQEAIASYRLAALRAKELGLGINAGHDLSFDNLHYFKSQLIQLDEVSIGHAIISEALYLGIENCIQLYKNELIR